MTSTTESDTQPGAGLAVGTLVAGCLAVCLAQIGLALPAVLNGLFQTDLHPIGSQLTWISDAFLLPVAVLELTFGVFGDLFGRKRLLVGGAAMVAIGELIAATAPGVHVIWVGMALAGLGSAALFPTSLAMLAAGTRTPRERARSIAIWAGFLSAGGFISPVIGGITGNYGSWRAAFYAVAIIAAASVVVSLVLARDSRSPGGRSIDPGGQVTLAISLFALLYALIQAATDGWGAANVVAGLVVGAVFFALFIMAELRARSPLLRLELFRNRAFAVASAVTVVGMFSFLGTAYATSIRMGPIQGQSPLRTIIPFLLLQGPTFVLIPLTWYLQRRFNPRWALGAGFALIAAGDFWAGTLAISDSALTSLVVPLGLVGVGFALAINSFTATSVNTVPIELEGMASATTSLLRDFGFTLGPALIAVVALGQAGSSFAARLGAAHLGAAQMAAVQGAAKAGGPLAVNGIPAGAPGAAAHSLALSSLGHGYAIGYVFCAVAALAASLATLVVMGSAPLSSPE